MVNINGPANRAAPAPGSIEIASPDSVGRPQAAPAAGHPLSLRRPAQPRPGPLSEAGLTGLASRNAPIPNRRPAPLAASMASSSAAASPAARAAMQSQGDIETGHAASEPTDAPSPESSRNVSFARKLRATLSTGMGVGVPLAALNVGAEKLGGAVLETLAPGGFAATGMKPVLTAAGLGMAADAALTTLVAAAGHAYLDQKFYHDKGKTADEMIAAKKANSAILSYLGGTGTSLATSLAATALTGGSVTAGTVKTVLATQVIGGLVVHPVVLGAAAGALAWQRSQPAPAAPDSLQAGLQHYADAVQHKLASAGSAATSSTAIPVAGAPSSPPARGEDMV